MNQFLHSASCLAFLGLLAASSPAIDRPQASRTAPPPCVYGQTGSANPYEVAAAADPDAVDRLLDLARCYDVQWRFEDAEKSIVRALELVRRAAASAAALPAVPDVPVVVGAAISAPQKTRDAAVEYPEYAVSRGIRGVVIVEARIDRNGRVRNAKAVEPVTGLDQAAVGSVKRWEFKPTVIQGQAAEVTSFFFIRFGLPRELVPADWVDMARFYGGRGLPAHAIAPLEAALARERRDRERFAEAVRVGNAGAETVSEPVKIRDVNPTYPAGALAAGIKGTVIIEALIDRFGDVGRARIIRSVPMLDAAAMDAVAEWRYTPAQLNGEPVSCQMTVTVNFSLR